MDNLFWFYRNLRLREFFHEDTGTATNNNNTVYNKNRKERICPNNLKISHSVISPTTRPL